MRHKIHNAGSIKSLTLLPMVADKFVIKLPSFFFAELLQDLNIGGLLKGPVMRPRLISLLNTARNSEL